MSTAPASEAAIADWLRLELGASLGLAADAIDPRVRFKTYGLDSSRATALVARLGAWLGRSLPATLVWEQPTIALVARELARGADPARAIDTKAGAPAKAASADEPIAIVGIGCRFPGDARSPAAFWDLLRRGVDAITEVPPGRWNVGDYFDADRTVPGKMSTRWGGFVDGVDRFDARFFGIAPREAVHMDPQQRVMLEIAWEALEDARIAPGTLVGSATGVFVGAMWSDYARLLGADPEMIAQHSATGQDTSIVSARISYALGLQGPSMTVNTACSSSLLAVHLACESLRRGESTLALAGGVSLVVSPLSTVAMTKFGAMSPEGRCRAFDARANGYVRGEGAGCVVLKPLSRALADGDPIYAVIAGSAVNNDGFSNGLTAPNPKAQEDVLRAAYARAGVAPSEVQYVEAHGPGTLLGDPIEANALGAVLGGANRGAAKALRLGSVKTNFGHTEAAAGIAGLIKVALCAKHRALVPTLHYEKPNPHVAFEALSIQVQRELGAWPEPEAPLIAGVSSFGFGGTNCHLVVRDHRESEACVAPIDAETPEALERAVLELLPAAARVGSRDDLEALCSMAACDVTGGAHRVAIRARSGDELRARLLAELARRAADRGPGAGSPPRVVFVCPGQGSQWVGMAVGLMRSEPVFRAQIEACDRSVRAFAGWSLIDELVAPAGASRMARVDVVQPVLFAIQIALGALWRSWGIEPSAIVGHSMGEVAACHLAGVLDLDDAVRIMCVRSALVGERAGGGGMLVVDRAADVAMAALGDQAPGVSVAAYNGPTSCVLSGDAAAIDRAALRFVEHGVRTARVNVDYASHSPQMDGLRADLMARIGAITPHRATVRLLSTLEARAVDGTLCDAAYWADNLRHPVRFAQIIDLVLGEGDAVFVELSPHPILTHAIDEAITARGARASTLASCRREKDERGCMLDSLAALYTAGAEVRWDRVSPGTSPSGERELTLLPLSARTTEALASLARAYGAALRDGPAHARDLAYGAAVAREHFDRRVAIVASTRAEMIAALDAFAHGNAHPAVVRPGADGASPDGDGLAALAHRYVNGEAIDWRAVHAAGGRTVPLPTYPWQRKRFWIEDLVARAPVRARCHPLLGPAQTIAGESRLVVFESTLDPARAPYLGEQRVAGIPRVPAGVYVEMAAAAGPHASRSTAVTLEHLVLHTPLAMLRPVLTQAVYAGDGPERGTLRIASQEAGSGKWILHATAQLRIGPVLAGVGTAPEIVQARCRQVTGGDLLYTQLAERGFTCGATLRAIDRIWIGHGEAIARVRLPDDAAAGAHLFVTHPVLFEACMHAALALAEPRTAAGPAAIERVTVHRRPDPDAWLFAHVHQRDAADANGLLDAIVMDEAGRVIVEALGVAMMPRESPGRESAGRLTAADIAPASARA